MTNLRSWVRTRKHALLSLGMTRSYVNVRRLVLAAVLLAALFGGLAYLQSRGDSGSVSVEPARLIESGAAVGDLRVAPEKGGLAPDFEVSDFDGRRFRLSEFRGSPVVVKFWATWCSSCLAEFPHLKELHAQHQSAGLSVVAVNTGETYGQAKGYADFLDAPFDWALDPTLTIANAYRVIGFPVSVFIDRDGVIQAMYVGQMERDLMEEYVRAAIDSLPAPEAPFRLRFINNLARQNVVTVRTTSAPGELALASQRFRCDPVYCLETLPGELSRLPGVRDAEVDRAAQPPQVVITFNPARITQDDIVAEMKRVLEANPDPLYSQPLEVTYESEQGP
jgi:cytochrome c biogenesis protein CcmG/thiol:disulfide interchange protein DsbE